MAVKWSTAVLRALQRRLPSKILLGPQKRSRDSLLSNSATNTNLINTNNQSKPASTVNTAIPVTSYEPLKTELFYLSRSVLTVGVSMAAGDVTCQILENHPFEYPERTGAMFLAGTFITGPISYSWQLLLEKSWPGNSLTRTIQKTVGSSAFGFFVSLPVLFTAVTLINRKSDGSRGNIDDVKDKIKRDLIPTFLTGLCYWPIVNFVLFRYADTRNRALYSGLMGTVWNVYVASVANRPNNSNSD